MGPGGPVGPSHAVVPGGPVGPSHAVVPGGPVGPSHAVVPGGQWALAMQWSLVAMQWSLVGQWVPHDRVVSVVFGWLAWHSQCGCRVLPGSLQFIELT